MLPGLLDTRRPFSGSLILPRSLPADRIRATTIEAISAHLGTMTSGTIISGDPNGAHMIIGDAARGGWQVYSAPNRLVGSMSPLNSGNLLIGPLDGPNVRMVRGNVQIDGDCNVAGSIRANRLMLGTLGYTFLEEDRLVVGVGNQAGIDPDADGFSFTGFMATHQRVGGYNAGHLVWKIDNTTGKIVSQDTEYPSQIYTEIGDGLITISNINGAGTQHYIRLLSYVHDADTDAFIAESNVAVYTENNIIKFKTLTNQETSLALVDQDDNEMFSLGRTALRLTSLVYHSPLMLMAQEGYGVLMDDEELRLQGGGMARGLALNSTRTMLKNSVFSYQSGTGDFADRPSSPREGDKRWDSVNHREEYYDGSAWYYIEGVAV